MNIGAGIIPVGLSLFSVLDTQQPHKHEPIELNEKQFEFRVVGDEAVSHTFYFTNWTTETLQVTNVTVTEPIAFVFASPKVKPGQVGKVDFSLTEPRIAGDYEGEIRLSFKNRAVSNFIYGVTGKIVPAIEISPLPAFFVATQKGKAKSAALEIFNRTTNAVKILKAESESQRFDLQLRTMVEGEYYILTLNLKESAPAGRLTEAITVSTTDPKRPTFRIMANTLVREQVYAFPESLDFGQIDMKDAHVNRSFADMLSQTLMVYQHGGTDFSVSAETEIPFLKLSVERAESGDRCQLRIDVDPTKFAPGEISGSIWLKTNDKSFAQLEIPVRGIIANSEEF